MHTILIADDDVTVRRTIAQHLVRSGYVVREASTGKEALDVLRGGGVDLVITDVYMPDMDGIEFISRASQEVGAPKVIVISGGMSALIGEPVLPSPAAGHAGQSKTFANSMDPMTCPWSRTGRTSV